jgi:hypothetical protein
MTHEAICQKRKYARISLPKGMRVAWHGGDLQLFSRVRTLGMGGLFISVPDPPPVGTKLRLSFEVPGGTCTQRPSCEILSSATGWVSNSRS